MPNSASTPIPGLPSCLQASCQLLSQWLQGHYPHLADGPTQHSPCLWPLLFSGSLGYNSPSLHLVILPIKSTAQKATPSAIGKPGHMRIANVNMFCDGMLLGVGPILMWWGSLMQLPSHGAGTGERVEDQIAAASQSLCLNDLSTTWSVLACLNSFHWHAEGSAALSILPSSLQIVIRLLRVSKLLGS